MWCFSQFLICSNLEHRKLQNNYRYSRAVYVHQQDMYPITFLESNDFAKFWCHTFIRYMQKKKLWISFWNPGTINYNIINYMETLLHLMWQQNAHINLFLCKDSLFKYCFRPVPTILFVYCLHKTIKGIACEMGSAGFLFFPFEWNHIWLLWQCIVLANTDGTTSMTS